MALLVSILLQTFELRKIEQNPRGSKKERIQETASQDMPDAKYMPLKRAVQCLQRQQYRGYNSFLACQHKNR